MILFEQKLVSFVPKYCAFGVYREPVIYNGTPLYSHYSFNRELPMWKTHSKDGCGQCCKLAHLHHQLQQLENRGRRDKTEDKGVQR